MTLMINASPRKHPVFQTTARALTSVAKIATVALALGDASGPVRADSDALIDYGYTPTSSGSVVHQFKLRTGLLPGINTAVIDSDGCTVIGYEGEWQIPKPGSGRYDSFSSFTQGNAMYFPEGKMPFSLLITDPLPPMEPEDRVAFKLSDVSLPPDVWHLAHALIDLERVCNQWTNGMGFRPKPPSAPPTP